MMMTMTQNNDSQIIIWAGQGMVDCVHCMMMRITIMMTIMVMMYDNNGIDDDEDNTK